MRKTKMPLPGKGPRQGRMVKDHEDTGMVPQNRAFFKRGSDILA